MKEPPHKEKAAPAKGGRFIKLAESNAAKHLDDWPAFRNHRIVRVRYCLEPDVWEWLEWESASRTGGYLPNLEPSPFSRQRTAVIY